MDFEYSKSIQNLADIIMYDHVAPFIIAYDDDLAYDLLKKGNFLGCVESLMYCGVEGLEPIRDIYLRSQNLKDVESLKEIIKEINDYLKEEEYEFIFFKDINSVLEYLKENSESYSKEMKNVINQSFYLKIL